MGYEIWGTGYRVWGMECGVKRGEKSEKSRKVTHNLVARKKKIYGNF